MKTYFSLLSIVLMLTACGGGGGGGSAGFAEESPGSESPKGVFLDSAVKNIAYRTEAHRGFTNDSGEFYYEEGEQVIFSIGNIDLPTVQAQKFITPLLMSESGSQWETKVVNILRLLQSLDADGDPDNGIEISNRAHEIAVDMVVDFRSPDFDSDVAYLLENSNSAPAALVDPSSAISHFQKNLSHIKIAKLFPIREGARYYYNDESEAAVFKGSKSVSGRTITPIVYPSKGMEYYDNSDGEIAFWGFYLPQLIIEGEGQFAIDVKFAEPIVLHAAGDIPGPSQFTQGAGTILITPTYGNQAITYNAYVRYIGDEIVTLPYGTYATKHIGLRATISTTVAGYDFDLIIDTDYWLAEDIGAVKFSENGYTLELSDLQFANGSSTPFGEGVNDSDGDGINDFLDQDDDNDGVYDIYDAFSLDPTESEDHDNDGLGNNADPDDDNDGVMDQEDLFPFDEEEWADFDGDGLGDNADPDDDNDGVTDANDDYPYNPDYQTKAVPSVTEINFQRNTGYLGGLASALTIDGDAQNWSLESNASWLVPRKNGEFESTPGMISGTGQANVYFDVDATNLVPGSYHAQLTFTNYFEDSETIIDVNLTVTAPQFVFPKNRIVLDGSSGWANAVDRIDVLMDLGMATAPLTVTAHLPYSELVSISGVPSEVEYGIYDPSRITVQVSDPAQLSEGEVSGTLEFSVTINEIEYSATVDVDIVASEHLLLVPEAAVALASFPGGGRTTHSIDVLDSYGLDSTGWNTSTSASWLTPSSNGVTGEKLVLEADPTGLTANVLYTATVLIESDNPAVENSQTVKVGFWVGDADPETSATVLQSYSEITSDPLRPYVYVHSSNATDIDIYNVYNQLLEATISNVGAQLGDMEVDATGRFLYVADIASNHIIKIDLDDTDNRLTWQTEGAIDDGFTLAVTNGKELLFASDDYLYDPITGQSLFAPTYYRISNTIPTYFDVSLFGNVLCRIDASTITCYNLSYNSYRDQVEVSYIDWSSLYAAWTGLDLTLSSDGSVVYTCSRGYASASYAIEIHIIDTSIQNMYIFGSLRGSGHSVAVESRPDGMIQGVNSSGILVYDKDGSLLTTIEDVEDPVAIDRGLAVSGDGMISVILTSTSGMRFYSRY